MSAAPGVIRRPQLRPVIDVAAMHDDATDLTDRMTTDLEPDQAAYVEGVRDALAWALTLEDDLDLPAVKCDRCNGAGGWQKLFSPEGDLECSTCDGAGWVMQP